MISDTLIQFGLHVESNQQIDVAGVKRGNECGCICLSCSTPLVARQGNIKEWHFAHRSQKVHHETQKECEYSLAVSVRMMIRQLSENGLKFRTPRYACTLYALHKDTRISKSFEYVVTEGSNIVLSDVEVGVSFSAVSVDVLGLVDGVPLALYVTYKDRRIPPELFSPSPNKCGIVGINIDFILSRFLAEKRGQYIDVLRKYLEDETDGKSWVYHPREKNAKDKALKKRDEWLSQQPKYMPNTKSVMQRHKAFNGQSSEVNSKNITARNFECCICKQKWSGVTATCNKCATHIYTRELNL